MRGGSRNAREERERRKLNRISQAIIDLCYPTEVVVHVHVHVVYIYLVEGWPLLRDRESS